MCAHKATKGRRILRFLTQNGCKDFRRRIGLAPADESLRYWEKKLERFSGLMEQQSQSLAGLLSTLKDTLGQGLAGFNLETLAGDPSKRSTVLAVPTELDPQMLEQNRALLTPYEDTMDQWLALSFFGL